MLRLHHLLLLQRKNTDIYPFLQFTSQRKGASDVCLTQMNGISLNSVQLRFRQFRVAVTANVEQMFYRFSVPV